MLRRTMIAGMAVLALGAAMAPQAALAASPEIYTNSATGIAINGYDPVAYFTEGKPVEGSAEFATEWKGAPWHFASAQNRDMFLADPEKYAPQYGGYCAFALAHNALAVSVPEAWNVHNGKLYLNFSTGVRTQWQTDPDGFITRADGYWPSVLE